MYFDEKIWEICSFGPVLGFFNMLDLLICISNNDKKYNIKIISSPQKNGFCRPGRAGQGRGRGLRSLQTGNFRMVFVVFSSSLT